MTSADAKDHKPLEREREDAKEKAARRDRETRAAARRARLAHQEASTDQESNEAPDESKDDMIAELTAQLARARSEVVEFDTVELAFAEPDDNADPIFIEPKATYEIVRRRRIVRDKDKRAARGDEPVVTLDVTGNLLDEKLKKDDQQTFTRIAYCLQHELRPRHFLQFPNGRAPLIRYDKGLGGYKDQPPPGKPGERRLHLSLKAHTNRHKLNTFYGRVLSGSLLCTIEVQVLTYTDPPTKIDEFSVSHIESAVTRGAGLRDISRQTYAGALSKLAAALKQRAVFQK